MVQVLVPLPLMAETCIKFQTPGFTLAQPWLLWPFGE